jgi:SAM-dependent methyltransferase
MQDEKISFDDELSRGVVSYNEKVGHWWYRQATNATHAYAYRNIADYVRSSLVHEPELIADYACGAGTLLTRLLLRFPESRFLGVDGSPLMLDLARQRLANHPRRGGERVTFLETHLPNPDLPPGIADLVVFAFPNIVPCDAVDDTPDNERQLTEDVLAVARSLSLEPEFEGDPLDQVQEIYSTLLRDRLVSRNLRHILKPRGLCLRIEYANCRREELPRLEALRTAFEESSDEVEREGRVAPAWFRVLASSYYRSGVMEDVFHQSEDETDRRGGYFITVLEAT